MSNLGCLVCRGVKQILHRKIDFLFKRNTPFSCTPLKLGISMRKYVQVSPLSFTKISVAVVKNCLTFYKTRRERKRQLCNAQNPRCSRHRCRPKFCCLNSLICKDSCIFWQTRKISYENNASVRCYCEFLTMDTRTMAKMKQFLDLTYDHSLRAKNPEF